MSAESILPPAVRSQDVLRSRRPTWKSALIALALPALVHAEASKGAAAQSVAVSRPNIAVILLDDVGFGDTATFGGAAATPTLDALKSSGIAYNNFHTTGICAPTRAALLSGRNHHRVGFGWVREAAAPGYDWEWKPKDATLPALLLSSGYSTAAFGKWHNTLPKYITPAGPFGQWPTSLGFEYFYGVMLGVSSQWEPPLWRNTTLIPYPTKSKPNYYLTTDLVDEASRWLDTHNSIYPDKPYFLYFATGAAHSPHQVSRDEIAQYSGRFDEGWDALRREIFARQKRLKVIPSDAVLTSRPKSLPPWNSLSPDERRLFAHQMEVYAAFISKTDREIGRLVKHIRSLPGGDNTIIFYIVGDNGAEAFQPAGADDWGDYAGDHRPLNERLATMERLGSADFNNLYAAGWGWAGNTPFQWGKRVASHLGGMRNPMVISWPSRIAPDPHMRDQFTHVIDIAATIYDLVGINPPDQINGITQEPLDGISFAPTLFDPLAASHHSVQYFECIGNRGIFADGWFAGAMHDVPWEPRRDHDPESDHWELYDLKNDFSQSRNLAAKYPGKLQALKQLFAEQAGANLVYPLLPKFGIPVNPNRTSFVYHQGFPGQTVLSAPALASRSFDVTVKLDREHPLRDGVLLAYGGRDGGLSLYIKGNQLIAENNYYGRTKELFSIEVVPASLDNIIFQYDRNKQDGGAKARFLINGKEAASRTFSRGFSTSLDNFDIGRDGSSPVSNAYTTPGGQFSGKIDSVEINLR